MPYVISEQPNPLLESGSWHEYQGARFLIAHASNLRFQRRMQALQKPFRRKIERNEMDPADQKRIMVQALGETILIGWEGVEDKDGKEIQYTSRASIQMLSNDEALREFVMEVSMDLQNYRDDEEELEGKS